MFNKIFQKEGGKIMSNNKFSTKSIKYVLVTISLSALLIISSTILLSGNTWDGEIDIVQGADPWGTPPQMQEHPAYDFNKIPIR